MSLAAIDDRFIKALKKRARKYTEDTYQNPTEMDYMVIENAMLIGASLQIETEMQIERNHTSNSAK